MICRATELRFISVDPADDINRKKARAVGPGSLGKLFAIRPAMATVPGAMLLCASSPYARKGALWRPAASGDDVAVRESNPAKESDVVTQLQDKGVRVTNGHIDVDTGEDLVDCCVGQDHLSHSRKGSGATLHSEARVYRLTIVLSDRTEGGERRPLYQRKNSLIGTRKAWRLRDFKLADCPI